MNEPGAPRPGRRRRERHAIVRSKAAGRRLTRTIVLGSVVVLVSIAWLSSELGLDRRELAGYALTSLVLVAGLILGALAVAVVIRVIRRWF